MICLLFWWQTFFQIKDEDAVKKYVYFGGIEHSIRKEVSLITQETTKLFCEDIKITKAPLELSEIIFSQDLYQRTMQCQAVQFYLRSVHIDVRSLPRMLSRVATEMTLNFYKCNIEEKKNGQLSKGERLNVWCRWNNAARRKIVLTIWVLSPGIHRHHHHLDYTQY